MPSHANAPLPSARVLRHECADGSWHYDFLLAWRAPLHSDDACAHAWRIPLRVDRMSTGEISVAVPLPAHRAFYLGIQEPTQLSHGRGHVHPVAAGMVLQQDSAAIPEGREGPGLPATLRVRWESGRECTYRIVAQDGQQCIECVEASAVASAQP